MGHDRKENHMDYAKTADEVLSALGGKDNIASNIACMTRLRVKVHDVSKVDLDSLKKIEGVLNASESGDRFEVVFGPGIVNKVLAEFVKISGLKAGDDQEAVKEVAEVNKAAQKAKYDKPVQRFLKKIANIFVPLLPGIISAGLINGITNVINVSTNNAFATQWWYACLTTMGWALFLYLPLLVGMNASKEFGGSGVLGAMAGALSISNSAMPLLKQTTDGLAAVALPFAVPTPSFSSDTMAITIKFSTTYNPAAGGLLGALICGIFFAFLEKRFHKIMPNALDTFLTPLCTVIIGSIVAVIVLQPAGAFLTQGIFFVLQFVYGTLGIVGGYILASTFLPLVAVGLHQALTPIHAMLNDPSGPTGGINYLLPILMMAGGGQVGAGLALYVKTKNKKAKKYISESLPVGILGVGEPLMYAVTLPLGKPFITACLGAGFGGILAALFHLGTVSQGVSGLFGLLIVVPGTQLLYIIAMLAAYAGGFVLTWFFGIDEGRINDVFGE